MSTTAETLDLAKPRVIVLKGAKGVFTLSCRVVSADDWKAYFQEIEYTQKREGKDLVTMQDYDTARLQLAQSVLVNAEGYKLPEGKELTAIDNWQAKLPVPHRLGVADVLSSARSVAPDEQDAFLVDAQCVTLSCVWTAAADRKSMQSFKDLRHYFRTPSEEQHRRYARANSSSVVLGGERTGTTLFPGAQLVLMDLYDELIERIEGYTIGEAYPSTRDMLTGAMDAHHKVVAAQQVFQPQHQVAIA